MLLLQSILKEVIEESRQSVPRFGNVRFDRIDLEKHLQKNMFFFSFTWCYHQIQGVSCRSFLREVVWPLTKTVQRPSFFINNSKCFFS